MTITGGRIQGDIVNYTVSANEPKNITIRNSTFTRPFVIDGVFNANILLDHNVHDNINVTTSDPQGRLTFPYDRDTANTGVTVQNSHFAGGDADGIQTAAAVTIKNNEFDHIHENGSSDPAHSDPIQCSGDCAGGLLIQGNYVHDSADGIVAYDRLNHATIQDNVVDLNTGRWGIELYSDYGSIVKHNTLRYATTCEYAACGWIILDHTSTDPAGTNTIIRDNIATAIVANNGSTWAADDHNMVRQTPHTGDFTGTPIYTGGTTPTTYPAFKLTPLSPGTGDADDGLNVGARIP
jgi:hypothetical protein